MIVVGFTLAEDAVETAKIPVFIIIIQIISIVSQKRDKLLKSTQLLVTNYHVTVYHSRTDKTQAANTVIQM